MNTDRWLVKRSILRSTEAIFSTTIIAQNVGRQKEKQGIRKGQENFGQRTLFLNLEQEKEWQQTLSSL